jgi:drug/metabolite transporter (DMT)-like permease
MNTYKALICLIALALTLLLTATWDPVLKGPAMALMGSGALGLGIGDLFLLAAFARIGASRTLLLFGFQPVILGIGAALLFGQPLEGHQALAIFFFMLCLFILSFERYKIDGHWEIKGLLFALAGVLLDNSGILLTRWAFDHGSNLDPFQANFFRTCGALIFFGAFALIRPFSLTKPLIAMRWKDRSLVTLAALGGTYLSLSLYLNALKVGHLASISAIVLTGPIFSATLECILQRKAPSRPLILAFGCLFLGMFLILRTA